GGYPQKQCIQPGNTVQAVLGGGTTSPEGASVTFGNVAAPGDVAMTTSTSGPTPPSGFSLGDPSVYFNLSTTASFNNATVCINYTGVSFGGSSISLFHYNGSAWIDVTNYPVDTINQII